MLLVWWESTLGTVCVSLPPLTQLPNYINKEISALPDEFHDNLLKSEMGCTISKVGGNKYEMNHFAKGVSRKF